MSKSISRVLGDIRQQRLIEGNATTSVLSQHIQTTHKMESQDVDILEGDVIEGDLCSMNFGPLIEVFGKSIIVRLYKSFWCL